jgi:hypothetical protein
MSTQTSAEMENILGFIGRFGQVDKGKVTPSSRESVKRVLDEKMNPKKKNASQVSLTRQTTRR